jgi:hypothetical protein
MSAPDFYFGVNAMFRHIHDRYGRDVLIDYWRSMGREYYAQRVETWRQGGPQAIAADWRTYFAEEPQADATITTDDETVTLDIKVCPAIKHLRDHRRDIVPYYCEHCDHVCGAMAEAAGYVFQRAGGMGACRQQFVRPSGRHAPCAVRDVHAESAKADGTRSVPAMKEAESC